LDGGECDATNFFGAHSLPFGFEVKQPDCSIKTVNQAIKVSKTLTYLYPLQPGDRARVNPQ